MADPLKQWADSKLGKAPGPSAKAPSPSAPAPVAPVQPQKPKTPDVRADQMTWLGGQEQMELQGHEPDPPPSWIDPMEWEKVKVQMGQDWNALPQPRAAAAFMVHQAQQAAKAAMAPPGAPAAPGAPPAGGPPPSPKPAFGGPPKPAFGGGKPFGGK
jgi:hypothetical protein